MGQWLDQELLDPLGAWHCLLAARTALPEWDLLWIWAAVRSIGPMEDVNIRPLQLPLIYGPLASVLCVCGFVPFIDMCWLYMWKNQRKGSVNSVGRYILLVYCTLLLVSYPLSYEDWISFFKIGGIRYDRVGVTNLTSVNVTLLHTVRVNNYHPKRLV